MSLRNQPYLPLYVQDFLSDEKLAECSAQSTGVYIRLLCIMHKSDEYGKILLKQKDKQTDKQIKNFALKLAKQMPYSENIITDSLEELIDEKVLTLEDDYLFQKRMVKDNNISEQRAISGKKGGDFAQAKLKAKVQANYENEIEYEDVNKKRTILNEKKYLDFKKYLIDDILNIFGFSEMRNKEKHSIVNLFLNYIINTKKHPLFLDNYLSYKKYLEVDLKYSGYKILESFLGSVAEQYLDGGWNKRDWLSEAVKLDSTYKNIHKRKVEEILTKCNLKAN